MQKPKQDPVKEKQNKTKHNFLATSTMVGLTIVGAQWQWRTQRTTHVQSCFYIHTTHAQQRSYTMEIHTPTSSLCSPICLLTPFTYSSHGFFF